MRRAALVVGLVWAISWSGMAVARAVTSGGRVCTIVGTSASQHLYGTAGADVICGLGGNDILHGAGGNDWLDGGTGSDRLYGSAGADTLIGGSGTDVAQYEDHSAAVSITLDGIADDGSSGEHDRVAVDVENVVGTAGADVLVGTAAVNVLDGGAGNDRLYGGAGNDVLRGGDGADTMYGQAGDDRMTGGYGNDVLRGGDGTDTLLGEQNTDQLLGEAGNDRIDDIGAIDHVDAGTGLDYCHVSTMVAPQAVGCEVLRTGSHAIPAVLVVGTLLDQQGQPFAGAVVSYHQDYVHESSTTDALGRFTAAIPSGSLTARVQAGPATWNAIMTMTADSTPTYTLPAGRDVTVDVQDETGAAVAAAAVTVGYSQDLPAVGGLPGSTGYENPASRTTDGAGRALLAGSYRSQLPSLDVVKDGQHTGPLDVPVPPDGHVLQVLDRRPVELSGVVRSANGEPLDRVVTVLDLGPVSGDVTGPDGAYSLSGTRTAQRLSLQPLAAPGRPRDLVLTTPLDLRTAPSVLDLTLPPIGTFVVQLRDTAGQPVAGASVRLAHVPWYPLVVNTVTSGGRTWTVEQAFDSSTTDGAGEARFPVVGALPDFRVFVTTDEGTGGYGPLTVQDKTFVVTLSTGGVV